MKTVRVHELGDLDQLRVDDVSVPEPAAGEIRLQVLAAGVNFADLLMIAGEYQVRPDPPFAPGFEVAGSVSAVGEGVEDWALGDHAVAALWYGGYAEQVVVSAARVFPLPVDVDPVDAVAGTVTFGTAYHALVDRARLRSGETLLVTGATGGVGSAAVQVGKVLGAGVIGAVGSERKSAAALDLGADEVIVYDDEGGGLREGIDAITDRRGVDVVLDVVGGDVFDHCVRAVAPNGRVLVVGFTAGRIPRLQTNLVLLKESSVVGVYWGAFRDREPERARAQLDQIWDWVRDGALSVPPTATYPLPDAASALRDLARRRVVGKAVLVTGQSGRSRG